VKIGDRVVVINEADRDYGRRGTIEDLGNEGVNGLDNDGVHHPLYGVRLDDGPRLTGYVTAQERRNDGKQLSPFWPSELREISAIDQLSEIA
jgi:hypothetical protein